MVNEDAYIFQKGFSEWEQDSGVTYTEETTDWIYPLKTKVVDNTDESSISRTVEKGIGVQPLDIQTEPQPYYTTEYTYYTRMIHHIIHASCTILYTHSTSYYTCAIHQIHIHTLCTF